MTLAAVGTIYWPLLHMNGGPQAFSGGQADTFDATNDQIAGVFQSDISDSIAKIHMRVATITTAATMRMGVYALGTDGRPALSPTYWSANGTGATPSGDLLISGSNSWQTFTLTNAAVLVPGDKFAIVLSYVSGSTPNFQVSHTTLAQQGFIGQDQLMLLSNAGAAYAAGVQTPLEWIIEMTSAGVVSIPGTAPTNGAVSLTAFNTGTVDERALKFTAPFKCRVKGIRIGLSNLTAASAFLGSLWDSTADGADGQTPLAQSPSIDGDGVYATTNEGYFDAIFTTPYEVSAGTTYYAGVRNTTANAISLVEYTTATVSNAIRAFGIGSNLAHLGTRTWSGTNPGAWTDTTTTFPLISLIIDQLDDGAGAGGMITSRIQTGM